MTAAEPAIDKRLASAEKALERFAANPPTDITDADIGAMGRIVELAGRARDAASRPRQRPQGARGPAVGES